MDTQNDDVEKSYDGGKTDKCGDDDRCIDFEVLNFFLIKLVLFEANFFWWNGGVCFDHSLLWSHPSSCVKR